jgi:hypothetical protein
MTKRNITIKLLFISLIIATGCSKDLPQASLIGTWKEGRTNIGCSGGSVSKSPCTGSCNVTISATTFTDTDRTVYTYTVSGSTITLKSSTDTYVYTYELTAGSFTAALTDQSGCVLTIYYTKV